MNSSKQTAIFNDLPIPETLSMPNSSLDNPYVYVVIITQNRILLNTDISGLFKTRIAINQRKFPGNTTV